MTVCNHARFMDRFMRFQLSLRYNTGKPEQLTMHFTSSDEIPLARIGGISR